MEKDPHMNKRNSENKNRSGRKQGKKTGSRKKTALPGNTPVDIPTVSHPFSGTDKKGQSLESGNEKLLLLNDELRCKNLQLKESEEKNIAILELFHDSQRAASIGTWWIFLEDRKIHWTDEVFRIFGCNKMNGTPSMDEILERIHPDDLPSLHETVGKQVYSPGGAIRHEYRIVLPDSSVKTVEILGKMDFDEKGKPYRIIGTIQDITRRKEANEALAVSEQRLQRSLSELEAIINALPGMVSVVDREFNTLVANQAVIEKFGQSNRSDVLGKKCYFVRKKLDDVCPQCGITRAFETGKLYTRVSTPEEEQLMGIATKAYAIPLKDDHGQIWGGVEVIMDISDIREKEKLLRENEARFRAIIDQAGDALFVCNLDGKILNVNHQATLSTGYSKEELLQMTVLELDEHNSTIDRFHDIWDTVEPGGNLQIETRHRRKDGSTFPVEINLSKIDTDGTQTILGFVRDISERLESMDARLKFEQQLHKTQKLESLGVLAGGIAHDFNNLLGGIFGYIEIALHESDPTETATNLVKCLNVIERARSLTGQLLTFSKGGAPVRKVRPLSPFIRKTVEFALSGSNATVVFDLPDTIWSCNFDDNQLGQAIDNLVINAKQAMPMGGNLTIMAENISLSASEILELSAGRYVKVSVSDTGIGMPPEILHNIFDPFFTTKQVGSGLGLATCHSIIKRHGGAVDVVSEPGKGTTFKIYLPAVPEGSPVPAEPRQPVHHTASGRILIMDDEKMILETAEAHSRHLGYTPVCVRNGHEVIEQLSKVEKTDNSFCAVILDLTVPGGMGGRETLKALRKIESAIPVFVASGYADDPVISNPEEYGFSGSIRKPFTCDDLCRLLDRHLK